MRNIVRKCAWWAVLMGLSLVIATGLKTLHIPGELLLGPMIAAVILALRGVDLRVPDIGITLSQGVVGLMIGVGFPPDFLTEIAGHWPIAVMVTAFTVLISTCLGWVLMRHPSLPGSTAIWGFSAGAATVMTFMSKGYGADFRLVAFMQYVRVALVAMSAGLFVRFYLGITVTAVPVDWFPDQGFAGYTTMAAIIIGCSYVGDRLPLPGGSFLLPMTAGIFAGAMTDLPLMPPPWLKAASFAAIGFAIGLRFRADLVRHAAKAFPAVFGAIIAMIAANGVMAVVLSYLTGIDILTAFLANSPGGADSIAIIAMAVPVDVGFVMMIQTARFLVVLAVAPVIARRLSARAAG